MNNTEWTQERFEAFMERVRQEARRIDPRTARMMWWYAEVCDPYGLGIDLPDDAHCLGREYFLVDPNEGEPVLVSDVRAAHPEIPDGEWEEMMQAARKRDDTIDPFPMFNLYATPEERRKAWASVRDGGPEDAAAPAEGGSRD
jgi:hypothetical protein